MATRFIPFAKPLIGKEEIEDVVETLQSGWLTAGKRVARFEEDFKAYLGCKNAIAVNSGTAALHLALISIGIKKGDEIITTPFTFASTANVIVLVGAKPVFADIDKLTLNIDPSEVEKKVTPRTKAIIPVHFSGYPCDMDALKSVADKHGLYLIEDATHALGAYHKGTKIGADSEFAAFSFYPIKNITAAEGGMLVTNSADCTEKIKILRWYGLSEAVYKRNAHHNFKVPVVLMPGYKYNMNDIQAAIGIHQLKTLDRFNKIREQYFFEYINGLSKIEEIQLPHFKSSLIKSAYHLFVIRLKLKMLNINRSEFCNILAQKNIGTSYHYLSLHLHPYYKNKFKFKPNDFPVACKTSKEVISLPLYPKLELDELKYIIKSVKEIVQQYKC